MEHELIIVFRDGIPADNRKNLIKWLNGSVGGRGRDYTIYKPMQHRQVNIIRVKDKAKAALAKLMYGEMIITREQYVERYEKRR